jgi:hypothetical protein
MSLRQPPRFAEWLLEFLGYARQNRALMGDLLEEVRNGRSGGWYWRQTVTVIWNGVVKNSVGPRSFCNAILIGFAAQALLILTQHRLHSKLADAAASALWLAGMGVVFWAKRRAGGIASANFQQMIRAGETGSRDRSAVLRLVSLGTFVDYYLLYSLIYVDFGRVSLIQFAGIQLLWCGTWTLGPALLPAPIVTGASDAIDSPGCFCGYRGTESGLGVALSAGGTIILKRENLAETVFAAADEGLISALFGRGASLELVRRAIWLGAARECRAFRQPGPISLSELASLVDEAQLSQSAGAASFRVKQPRRKRIACMFPFRAACRNRQR